MQGRENNKTESPTGIISVMFSLLFMIFLSLTASSQMPDTLKIIREKPEKLLKNLNIHAITQDGFNFWKDKFSGHWAGIDFGLNSLTRADYTGYSYEFLKNEPIRSYSLSVNPVQQSIGLQRNSNTIGLVTGLGLQWLNYRLDKNTTLEESVSGKVMPKTLFFDDNQKSIFSLYYATLPVLIEFQVPVNHYNNRLFFSAGITGNYRISSNTKIRYRLNKKRENLKTPGDYSLHDLRFNLTTRAGYRNFQVFCNYDLQPLFLKEKGPKVIPLTFGITLLRF